MAIFVTTIGVFTFTNRDDASSFETDLYDYGYLNGRHTETLVDVIVVERDD